MARLVILTCWLAAGEMRAGLTLLGVAIVIVTAATLVDRYLVRGWWWWDR